MQWYGLVRPMLQEISLERVVAHPSVRIESEASFDDLRRSILADDCQPLVVQQTIDGHFMLIDGNRRLHVLREFDRPSVMAWVFPTGCQVVEL